MIYISFVLGVLLLAFTFESKSERTRRNGRKNFILAVSILLMLQSGMRHVDVGADTSAYKLKYERDGRSDWSVLLNKVKIYYSKDLWKESKDSGKDPGYSVLGKIFYSVVPSYRIYLLIVAAAFFSVLGCFIYRNTRTIPDALIAYLLYLTLFYSFFSITGIRQTWATTFSLIGYEFFIKKRRLLLFLLLMLIAASLHKSVMVFIPFYFIANHRPKKWQYWIILFLFPIFMYFSENTLFLLERISGYDSYGQYEGAGTYRFTGIMLLFSFIAFLRIKEVTNTIQDTQPMYNALALVIFFTPLTWINQSLMRLVQYFSLFIMVLAPHVINLLSANFKNSTYPRHFTSIRKLAFGGCLLFLLAYAGLRGLNTKYAFFWQ